MLQNRVDPFGNIIKTSARGRWMGNRGVLHDHKQNILRPFKLKAWITCKLEFKGWHRKVMSPDKYTELFFYDEATSFTAGHRPCFECRREDAVRFKSLWIKANPEYNFDEKISIQKIDKVLHNERINPDKSKATYKDSIENIPDGGFILLDNNPYLVLKGSLHLWTPFGYERETSATTPDKVNVLTPRSVINTFREGYIPQIAI